MKKLHIWPIPAYEENGWITTGFTIETQSESPLQIWYRLPAGYSKALTKSCDPFVVAMIFRAMQASADLQVHGEVSPSLLRNLQEFQSVWAAWKPGRYQQIEVRADVERECPPAETSAAVMTFSGGVDSCFTAWRHRRGLAGRLNQNLQAGLMIQGFDIPLHQKDTFLRASDSARVLLDSVGMELIPVMHNSKSLQGDLEDNQATILASCLMLLQQRFSVGLIASSVSYTNLLYGWQIPFGSTALTDWMLSSQAFSVIEDGAACTRVDKIGQISAWPEAMQYLRVCLAKEARLRDRNCCRCEKCVRNIITFRALGLDRPPCFEHDVSVSQILRLRYPSMVRIFYIELLLKAARERQISGNWLAALRFNLLVNRVRYQFKHSAFWKVWHR
jgi:hypothetical protein